MSAAGRPKGCVHNPLGLDGHKHNGGGIMPETVTRRIAITSAGAAAAVIVGGRAFGALGPALAEAEGKGVSPVYGHGLLVQLQVQDLERSILFYTGILGFKVTERRDDLQFVHVDCGVPGLQLGLSAGSPGPPAAGSVVLNFSVRGDVDLVRAGLEKQGVRFTSPTQIIPGKVRLAGFEDPDGYRLRLAGDDPPPPA